MSAQPAQITIARVHPDDVRDRQIVVSLDGNHIGTLMFGKTLTREIPAGPHRLKAHNTLFWKNLDIDLQPGEHARFEVLSRAGTGTLGLLGLIGVGPLFLTFQRVTDPA
ncbi:MAG: hypothetical protein ABI972_13760 [Acidobacteriota bacterium]